MSEIIDFGRNLLMGVVFDISMTHDKYGKIIDSAKKIVLDCVLNKDVGTKVYTSHFDWDRVPKDQGESTYFLISYKEPLNFKLDTLFKKAISMVGESVESCDKCVVLFTDRFQAPINNNYRKGLLFNEIRGFNLKIHIIGIGNNYDKLSLKPLCEQYGVTFHHVEEVQGASEILSKITGE